METTVSEIGRVGEYAPNLEGNTTNMTPHERFFTSLDRSKTAKVKFTSGDKTIMAEGIGDVTFITKEGNQTIKNVLYVPGIEGNALSVSQMEKSGFGVAFDEKRWNQKSGKCFGKTMWENRGYCLRWNVVIEGSSQSKKRKFTHYDFSS